MADICLRVLVDTTAVPLHVATAKGSWRFHVSRRQNSTPLITHNHTFL